MRKAFAVFVSGTFLFALSVGTAFAQPAGKAIVERSCTACHGIKKVTSANKNAKQWEATLEKMIKKGAKVSAQEKEAVLKYLNMLNK